MEPLVNAAPPPGGEEKESKEAPINLRIAAADRRTIEGKTQGSGLSVADYMCRAALGKTIVERAPPKLRWLLGLISSNLNQLTKLANTKLPGTGIEELKDLMTRLRQTSK